MIPVPTLIRLLAAKADDGDEDAAIQVNALVASYPEWAVEAASDGDTLVADKPQSLGDILAECFRLAGSQDDSGTPLELLDWITDATAAHYRLHRDDVQAALLDLEIEYAELHGTYNFGTLSEAPWGVALIASAVAERVTGQTPTQADLHLSYH